MVARKRVLGLLANLRLLTLLEINLRLRTRPIILIGIVKGIRVVLVGQPESVIGAVCPFAVAIPVVVLPGALQLPKFYKLVLGGGDE